MADVSLLVLGGALKRKEKLSGRFADALGNMYLCSAVLKRFEDAGHPKAELPLVHWACQNALFNVQEALHGIVRHFPVTLIGWKLRAIIFPLGRQLNMPSDHIGHQVARLMMVPDAAREALIDGIYLPDDPKDIIGRLEHALMLTIQADEIEKRLREAGHRYTPSESHKAWVSGLKSGDMISKDEAALLNEAHRAVHEVIMVDDFPAGRKRSR
jgi:acyl-CoA dehydrogenase